MPSTLPPPTDIGASSDRPPTGERIGPPIHAPGALLRRMYDPSGTSVRLTFAPELVPAVFERIEALKPFVETPPHAGLVPLIRADRDAGSLYYAIGEGRFLGEILADRRDVKQPKAAAEFVNLAATVLAELGDAARAAGCAATEHGNLQPWRILLYPGPQVRFLGWGLRPYDIDRWRAEVNASGSVVTKTQYQREVVAAPIHSLRYAAPEHLGLTPPEEGGGADVFALAVLAAEIAGGVPLITEEQSDKIAQALMHPTQAPSLGMGQNPVLRDKLLAKMLITKVRDRAPLATVITRSRTQAKALKGSRFSHWADLGASSVDSEPERLASVPPASDPAQQAAQVADPMVVPADDVSEMPREPSEETPLPISPTAEPTIVPADLALDPELSEEPEAAEAVVPAPPPPRRAVPPAPFVVALLVDLPLRAGWDSLPVPADGPVRAWLATAIDDTLDTVRRGPIAATDVARHRANLADPPTIDLQLFAAHLAVELGDPALALGWLDQPFADPWHEAVRAMLRGRALWAGEHPSPAERRAAQMAFVDARDRLGKLVGRDRRLLTLLDRYEAEITATLEPRRAMEQLRRVLDDLVFDRRAALHALLRWTELCMVLGEPFDSSVLDGAIEAAERFGAQGLSAWGHALRGVVRALGQDSTEAEREWYLALTKAEGTMLHRKVQVWLALGLLVSGVRTDRVLAEIDPLDRHDPLRMAINGVVRRGDTPRGAPCASLLFRALEAWRARAPQSLVQVGEALIHLDDDRDKCASIGVRIVLARPRPPPRPVVVQETDSSEASVAA